MVYDKGLIKYNKLVRDNTSKLLEKKGIEYKISIAEEDEKIKRILDKVKEEVEELLLSQNSEEIGDIIEALKEFCNLRGISWSDVEVDRLEKLEKKGGFKKGLILQETFEK